MLLMLVQQALYPQSIFPTSTLEILKLLSLLPRSSLPVDAEGTPSLESAEVPPCLRSCSLFPLLSAVFFRVGSISSLPL